ncbi:MAG: hypothetical protein ACRDKT_12575 [Actinomycetota bacterium]
MPAASRRFSALCAFALVLSTSVFLAAPASATHPANSCIDVDPEADTNPVGTSHTLTATLRTIANNACTGAPIEPAGGGVTMNFEISGANARTGSPDLTCRVRNNQTSCTVSYTGTNAGQDAIQGWLDHDEDGVLDQGEPTVTVAKTWTPAANTLDCDDATGPDTERESNPSASGTSSSEAYTCTATVAGGVAAPAGTVINAEVENGINDPDATDGTSYVNPDYTCAVATNGSCQITVTQNETETGTAEICFWIGSATEAATLCGTEPTDENQVAGGADSGNDFADQTELTWTSAAQRLDCDPEGTDNQVGAAHTITCIATDTAGANLAGVAIDVEIAGANDPDVADSPASPDMTCTTAQNGRCSVTHGTGGTGTTTATGVTTYRAWVDADGTNSTVEADVTEGNNEQTTPGADAEPDDTDVVIVSWSAQPPPPLTCPGFETDARTQVVGDVGDNILQGTEGPDIVCGLGGDDILEGLGAGDLLLGGGGSDIAKGGAGTDAVRGDVGDDILKGGGSNDQLRGGRGNDIMDGGRGTDACRGGPGRNVRRRCEL